METMKHTQENILGALPAMACFIHARNYSALYIPITTILCYHSHENNDKKERHIFLCVKTFLMKRQILFITIIIGLITIFILKACIKEAPAVIDFSNDEKVISSEKVINLTTCAWQENSGGVYICTFDNAIKNEDRPYPVSSVKIYLDETGELISGGAVSFMDGEVWASYIGTNVKAYFRTHQTPFESPGPVNIKVDIQYE